MVISSIRHVLRGFGVIALLLVIGNAQAQTQTTKHDVKILYHEALPAMLPETLPQSQQADRGTTAAVTKVERLVFDAFQRRFELHLSPNDRLLARLPAAQRDRMRASMRLFQGRLADVKGSWVRLTKVGEQWSGMIWDGKEVYLIDPYAAVAAALQHAPQPGTSSPPSTVIYRLSDTVMTRGSCALDTSAQPIHRYRALLDELREQQEALPVTTRQLDLAVVADAQFVQQHAANPEADVMTRLNVVDGIYAEQVGVHLELVEVRLLQNNGALNSTDPGTLLNQFGTFASSSGFTNPGLAHLITGRDLAGSTIGIAYLASLCSARFGVGVSQVGNGGTAGALTIAHEIGHNFGAPHDHQAGSACASAPDTFLMNPVLNGSNTFSACSLDQMRPQIDRAGCIFTPPGSPSVTILAPANNASFVTGTSITLTGRADDGAGNNLTAAIVWRSNLDGPLGTGGSVTVRLSVGTHTITAAVADATGGSDEQSITVRVTNGGGSAVVFSATFDTGADGFTFVPDTFRNTNQPTYARGDVQTTGGFSGGGLRVRLGGLNNTTVLNMSGGWERAFTLQTSQRVRLSFRYRLVQGAPYEPDEISQALCAVDNDLVGTNGSDILAQFAGDGNSGSAQNSGWIQVSLDLGVLAAGRHTVTLGGFNNKKTSSNELTTIRFDNVVVETLAGTSARLSQALD